MLERERFARKAHSVKRRRFNHAQKVVTVVALALALYSLGTWIVSLGTHLPYGSATYSNVSSSNLVGGLHPWVQFMLWMLLLALWVGVSIPLLKAHSMNEEG